MFNAFKTQAIVLAIFWFGVSGTATAQSGYSNNVVNACANASRPAPKIAADNCSTCHISNRKSATPAKSAYSTGGTTLLDFFCAATTTLNHAPVVSVPSNSISVVTGSPVNFSVSAQDPDAGDTVTLSATLTGVPGATFDTVSGQFNWTAGAVQNTPYQAVFKATDKAGLASSTTVAITVRAANTNSNTAPNLSVPLTQQNVTVGQNLTFEIKASDAEGDDVQITAQSLPTGASLSPAVQDLTSGEWISTFSWKPDSVPSSNPLSLTFTGTDLPADTSTALSSSKTLKILVNANSSTVSIAALNFSKAQWDSRKNRLEVSGLIKPLKGKRLPKNLTVNLIDTDTGEVLAAAIKVNKKGLWKFTSAKGLSSQPCQVTANAGGLTATIPVDRSCTIEDEDSDDDDHEDEHGHDDSARNQHDDHRKPNKKHDD
jgi:hypothetical protein